MNVGANAKPTKTKNVNASNRCLYCNSLSHPSRACNSNMNGRRNLLDSMANCMMLKECPDFSSFAINELRYIATNYAMYEKTTWPYDHMGNRYNRKYLLHPISMTLSKNRTVRALVDRWTGFAPVRELRLSEPESNDCPICYDNMFVYHWDQCSASWKDRWVYTYGAKYECPMVVDNCKHTFCGRCWAGHTEQNKKYDALRGQYFVNCPLCRAVVHF